MPGARDLVPSSPRAIRAGGATQQSRWRFEASAQHEPWDGERRATIARIAARDAASGNAHRAALGLEWQQRSPWGYLSAGAFAQRRDVSVVSTPASGFDHLRQHDFRTDTGFTLRHALAGFATTASFRSASLDAGAAWLGAQSQQLGTLREDRARQSLAALDLRRTMAVAPRIDATAGVRLESWRFTVGSDLPGRGAMREGQVAAPYLRLEMGLTPATRAFAHLGTGDDRGVRAAFDPRTRSPLAVLDPMSDATATTIGLTTRWRANLETTISAARTRTARELTLHGADGIALDERGAIRDALRIAARWDPLRALTLDAEAAWIDARFADGSAALTPLAARHVATAGATVRPMRGWSASLFVSHFATDAVEDEGERLRSSTLVNARLNYNVTKRTRLSLDVFNVFDRDAAPIDYYAASRLWAQPGMADDFLFHPAEPRGFRLRLRTTF